MLHGLYELTFCRVLASWCASEREMRPCFSRYSSICPILRVSRNLGFQDKASEVLEGSEDYVIGNWRSGILLGGRKLFEITSYSFAGG